MATLSAIFSVVCRLRGSWLHTELTKVFFVVARMLQCSHFKMPTACVLTANAMK